jgi:hypothetical protein
VKARDFLAAPGTATPVAGAVRQMAGSPRPDAGHGVEIAIKGKIARAIDPPGRVTRFT